MNLFEQIGPRCPHCAEHDAYHEAGHAVIAVITYRRIRRELYLFYLRQIEDMQNLAGMGIAEESDVEEAWEDLDKITRGPLDEISIIPDATSNGRTKRAYLLGTRNVKDGREDPSLRMIAEAECALSMAGFAAQRLSHSAARAEGIRCRSPLASASLAFRWWTPIRMLGSSKESR
jgi:hypothetical protein